MRLGRFSLVVLGLTAALTGLTPGNLRAQQAPDPIVVAVRPLAPFVIEDDDGELSGFSVDLAREIALELGTDISFVMVDNVGEQLDAVESGDADAAIGAISITKEREEILDFSQPMFDSGIQIAVSESAGELSVGLLAGQVFTWPLLVILGAMAVGTVVTGLLIWLLERRRNPDFGSPGWRGTFEGLWWAIVTLFTVGYGDKVPSRITSRLMSMVWMFAGVLLVATLTAEVTANLTVDRIESSISSASDLYGKDVLTIPGTTSSDFLAQSGIAASDAADPEAALQSVAAGNADAFVYDSAVLQYLIAQNDATRLAGPILKPEAYGIAFATDSELVEQTNRALLELREDGTYERLVAVYFS
jgi:ABC-type amino acid transport substrate-binding protein